MIFLVNNICSSQAEEWRISGCTGKIFSFNVPLRILFLFFFFFVVGDGKLWKFQTFV